MTPAAAIRAQADALEAQAAELRRIADALDAGEAPERAADEGMICFEAARQRANVSATQMRRLIKDNPGLAFKTRASKRWHVDPRRLAHLLLSTRGEFGGFGE